MKHLKTHKQLNEVSENLGITDVNDNNFSCDIYATDGGLGYLIYAYLIRLDKTENGYNYLIIDITQGHKKTSDYQIGSVVEIEDIHIEKVDDYKLRRSELWDSFLFQFFLKNYCS